MSAAAKIAIFGGSFNPVHTGHVGLVKSAFARLDLDLVIVVPAFVSPFKTSSGERDFFAPEARLKLVKEAFKDFPKVVVDTRELDKGGVSYTIDTVREIAKEHPGAKLYLLMGDDAVQGLERWKDYAELKRLCEFEVFKRTPESSTAIRERLRQEQA